MNKTWKLKAEFAVSGLHKIGFYENTEYLLVVTTNGLNFIGQKHKIIPYVFEYKL